MQTDRKTERQAKQKHNSHIPLYISKMKNNINSCVRTAKL